MSCNKSLLHTLFFNLINNGIKYNRSGGSIYLIGFWESSAYKFQIKDTGIGIAPENIPFIFNRFKRFQKSEDESFGLGLPIVKTIADFHGIKIQVTSTPEEGSTFTLILKKAGTVS